MLGFSPLASAPLADDGGGPQEFIIAADAGSFALTGQAVGLPLDDELAALEGVFALTGQDVGLNRNFNLAAAAGSFTVTGIDAEITRVLIADAGSFSATGQASNFDINFDATVDLVQYDVSVATGTNQYGTGNKYYISGSPEASPTVILQAGITYRFDQSDSSNSGHPFRFSTTPNGTHASGTEYTTGVTVVGSAGSAGAYVQIEVTGSTPTLYYYCTAHSGMGGTVETDGRLFNIVAQDASISAQFNITADAGSFAATGQDIGFRFDGKVIAQQGTYIVSPQQITDNTRKVAGTGQFTLTGQSFGIEYPLPVSEGTFTLSGQANVFGVTLSAGTASLSLTGQAANTNTRIQNGSGSFTLTGQDAAILPTTIVDAETGVFTLTGQTSDLLRNYALFAEAGSYSLTFQDTDTDVVLGVETGNFVLTGQGVSFNVNLPVGNASYTLTQNDATFNVNVPVDAASFAINGFDASFAVNFPVEFATYSQTGFGAQFTTTVPVEAGSFVFGAEDAALDVNYYMLGAHGSFALTGQDTTLIGGKVLDAEAGSFVLTADDARLEPELTLPANAGVFSLTGQSNGFGHVLEADKGTFVVTYYDADIYRASTRRAVFITANSTNQALIQSTANSAVLDGNYNKAA